MVSESWARGQLGVGLSGPETWDTRTWDVRGECLDHKAGAAVRKRTAVGGCRERQPCHGIRRARTDERCAYASLASRFDLIGLGRSIETRFPSSKSKSRSALRLPRSMLSARRSVS